MLHIASLPGAIRTHTLWTFKCVDRRRHDLMGADGMTLTGVEGKAFKLPFTAAGREATTTTMRLDPDKYMEDAIDSDDTDVDEGFRDEAGPDLAGVYHETALKRASDLEDGKKWYMGWKCAYRTQTPDFPERNKMLRRLTKVKAIIEEQKVHLAKRKSPAQTAEERADARAQKSARERAERAAQAEQRQGARLRARISH